MISKICDNYEIPMLDLTESIYKNGGITLFRDYLHLNGKGNNIVADQLERYLANEIGLIQNSALLTPPAAAAVCLRPDN